MGEPRKSYFKVEHRALVMVDLYAETAKTVVYRGVLEGPWEVTLSRKAWKHMGQPQSFVVHLESMHGPAPE